MSDEKMREALEDAFAEIEYCINSVQGALRHRQQPQDYHFHTALKACRDGRAALSTKQEGEERSRSQTAAPLLPIRKWLPIATAPTMGAFLAHDEELEITRIVLPIDRDNYVTVDRLMLFNATHWQPLPASLAQEQGADVAAGDGSGSEAHAERVATPHSVRSQALEEAAVTAETCPVWDVHWRRDIAHAIRALIPLPAPDGGSAAGAGSFDASHTAPSALEVERVARALSEELAQQRLDAPDFWALAIVALRAISPAKVEDGK
jgi:hypothetical protein